jgi:hypothetical protein
MRRDEGSKRDLGMKIEFSTKRTFDGEYTVMKMTTDLWNEPKGISLISMVGKAVLENPAFPMICYDFSGMPLIHSMLLGECANFIKLAQDNNKKIKMRFNKESAELVRTTRLDKLVDIEEV